jgi:hypothetical protein
MSAPDSRGPPCILPEPQVYRMLGFAGKASLICKRVGAAFRFGRRGKSPYHLPSVERETSISWVLANRSQDDIESRVIPYLKCLATGGASMTGVSNLAAN